jgi:hypothetical protein
VAEERDGPRPVPAAVHRGPGDGRRERRLAEAMRENLRRRKAQRRGRERPDPEPVPVPVPVEER